MNDTPEQDAGNVEEELIDFTAVWKGYDPAQGQMLEELLRQEGFTSRLIGTRTAALVGMGQFTSELRIEVPSDRAEEARAVLDKFKRAPSNMPEMTSDMPAPDSGSDSE